MAMPEDIMEKLSLFDFSKLARHGFVHSVGGTHYSDAWRKTTACGLGKCLDELGLRTSDSVRVDVVTSSLGYLDDPLLRALDLVAQGDAGSPSTLSGLRRRCPRLCSGSNVGEGRSSCRRGGSVFASPSLQTTQSGLRKVDLRMSARYASNLAGRIKAIPT